MPTRNGKPRDSKEYWDEREALEPGAIARRNAKSPAAHLRRRYGITVEERDAVLAYQGGKCATCRKPFNRSRVAHCDHRHSDGLVRGFLCYNCNTTLGVTHENDVVLQALVDYIRGANPFVEVFGVRYVPDSPGAAT